MRFFGRAPVLLDGGCLVKKLLKLVVLGLVLVLGAQAQAVCRRCMVNRAGAVQNFDYGQYEAGSQDETVVCVRQISDKTVANMQTRKQGSNQPAKQASKLQAAKAKLAVWAAIAQARMLEARVRVANWAQAKAAWVRGKKQALAAYIKARRPRSA
jgi:hypothetical protein